MSTYARPQQPHPVHLRHLWLTIFSSALAAILIGGLVIGLGVRSYLRWSVADSAEKLKQEIESRRAK